MGVKKEFYDGLRSEFENGQRASFLYRYLEQERQDSPREDDYAKLERCFSQMNSGGATQREYLILALQVLLRNGKLHPGRARELLLDYGRRLGGQELFRGKRRDSEKYQILLDELEAGNVREEMGLQDVRDLHRELLSAILCRDAQTYLYDVGRKKNRDLAMLEAYCEDKEMTLVKKADQGTSFGRLSAKEREDWETLFEALRREKRSKVLIPIRIDPRTGAGLYIVGSSHYPKGLRVEEDRQGACYYTCFYLDELEADEDVTLIFRSPFAEDLENWCNVPDLEEAQKWYFHEILPDDAVRIFRDNGSAPEGCPPELRRYFEFDKTPSRDREALPQKGRDAFLRDST